MSDNYKKKTVFVLSNVYDVNQVMSFTQENAQLSAKIPEYIYQPLGF